MKLIGCRALGHSYLSIVIAVLDPRLECEPETETEKRAKQGKACTVLKECRYFYIIAGIVESSSA